MKGFLYGQTEYNLLRNTIHLNDYIQTAKKHSFSFLSLTDRHLYGCYKIYRFCKQEKIKPIIGLEIEYMDDDAQSSFVLVYATDDEGYKELVKISTELEEKMNRIQDLAFLNSFSFDHLALILVYNNSYVQRLFLRREYERVLEKLQTFLSYPRFYVGYSTTNRLDLLEDNIKIQEFCRKAQIKMLPLHQCCYLKQEDRIVYETLRKIGGEEIVLKEEENYAFDPDPVSTRELETFVCSVDYHVFEEKISLPKYPNTKGVSSFAFLEALCLKGLDKRLKGQVSERYRHRLNYELSVIRQMGFEDYFLIVWDFILYAKKKKILVGPGRGSAVGSLVAYCLGITEIDPLLYDLLFERFLNPERISMPDIDTDFPDDCRDDVIRYVQQLYGAKHVCMISAYNTFLAKSSIRDLGRVLKIDNDRIEELIKLVISEKDYDVLLEQFKEREDIYRFLYIVKSLENLPRHISTHAAGIILSARPLDDLIPLQNGLNGLYQSQFEASDLEQIGLLKIDFLGIRNLTILNAMIHRIPGLDLKTIPLNDPLCYRLLQKADTLGIFQLESDGIRKVLLRLQPERFEDLVAVLALYRPGPMENIDEFIERRHGKPYQYLPPSLEPILKSTYGIIVYQEQIMKIAQVFADFSLGQADLLRRAVSKKDEEKLRSMQQIFIKGSVKKGFSLEVAQNIYQYILKFANYGFNKSHSVAYSLLSYQMLYIKARHFPIFISNILNNVIGATKTMIGYIRYAAKRGVPTLKPNINVSTSVFELTSLGLFMPFQTIHSIGETIALQIVEERKKGLFTNFEDFKRRCRFVNENVLEALIYAGAFDLFGQTKKALVESKEIYNDIFNRYLEDTIEDSSEYDFSYLQEKERLYLGFNITYDLFKSLNRLSKQYQAGMMSSISLGQRVRLIVVFDKIKPIVTKKSEKMLAGTVRQEDSTMEFVLFPKIFRKINFTIAPSRLYLILVTVLQDNRSTALKLSIEDVSEIKAF